MVMPDTHASLFVGLGNMGRPMAINHSPGRELFVCDTKAPVVLTAQQTAERPGSC
ncbi:hypothetical protein ARGLB_037_01060 [Arthrobacter globiformis NBRC 12137]|uniref:6-phosphogluconate dehydrogenase NADP-binding domain-containing protein n=1 Tax=Arthrobacter globiformis (strain ATCC 8010 / DSM 20124 / JCM 1332 / NBRC 12137 / NCIMB 8907 / NRRL B-2979 / 168) TaxID=1077972 RepID=H0QK15_ARTG1|nr:hypothetical protein [Arthrobacter globiformis]GAB13255.1 hypothetical protein ARGLB_037_01060 [Arthrobacter globiformis NBRC 12137]